LKIKEEITTKCDKIKRLKGNLQTIAYIEPRKKENVNFYSDNEDSDEELDDDHEYENYNPYDQPKKIVEVEEGEGGDILQRLLKNLLN
jgi:hypothetical protein